MSSKKVIGGRRRRGLISGVVLIGLIGFALRENTQLVKMASKATLSATSTSSRTTTTSSTSSHHHHPDQDDINRILESNSKVLESNSKVLESNAMILSLLQSSNTKEGNSLRSEATTFSSPNSTTKGVVLKTDLAPSSPPPIADHGEGRPAPFRFLFGIFSVDNPKDHIQRQAIRETYLNHYHRRSHYFRKWNTINTIEYNNEGASSAENSKIICSLSELQNNILLQSNPFSCQFVYTFVLGGNPNAPSEIFWEGHPNNSKSSKSMTSNQIIVENTDILTYNAALEYETHKDIILLNVRENQNDGKVPTWYTYVAALMEEKPSLKIDFVGKLDSDTLVKPQEFSKWTKTNYAQLNQTYVHGGWIIPCKNNRFCNVTNMKAPLFMPGGFNFVSMSVARFVSLELTTDQKKSITVPGLEDISWSNLVYSVENIGSTTTTTTTNSNKITSVSLGPTDRGCGIHNLKDPMMLRSTYETLFRAEMQEEEESIVKKTKTKTKKHIFSPNHRRLQT